MEPSVVKSRGRPRKRRREEIQNVDNNDISSNKADVQDLGVENNNRQEDIQITGNPRKRGRPPKKRPVEIRGQAIVGRYVLKEFEGNGIFLGKIVSYDTGLYRVDYEDGDCEDLDSNELRNYLIGDEHEQLDDLCERKKKLDEKIAIKTGMKLKDEPKEGPPVKLMDEQEKGDVAKPMDKLDEGKVEVPSSSEPSNGEVDGSEVDDSDDESDSDSCEYGQGWDARSETETPAIPPPELPPSSGTIGVPEEYVSHLFSVYGFLRSFSIRLFLSPFTLDDLVGCLNCTSPNTLLDAIHVALLRALRRHLETLTPDVSELASKCLRCIDWGLLDMLTWPVYLVHYLMVMGHLDGDEWKVFYTDVLEKDYCTLSVGTKLTVLQILCDDALDTAEIRAEIDMREESEVGVDCDAITTPLESGPRKVYPRFSKTSFGKDMDNVSPDEERSIQFSPISLTVKGHNHNKDAANVDEDANGDECRLCGMEGMLLCCDGCPSAYHSRCIGVNKLSIPEGEWFCPECTISRLGPPITVGTTLKGAEFFGVDSYAQLFLGTCNHLLVLKISVKTSPFLRYYNRNDIPKVLAALNSSPHHAISYLVICQAILKYWELPQDLLPPLITSQTSINSENKDEHVLPTDSHPSGGNGSPKVVNKVELENYASSVGETFVDNMSSGAPILTDLTKNPRNATSKLSEQAELSCSTQGLTVRLSMKGIDSCNAGQRNGVCLPESMFMHGKKDRNVVGGRKDQKWKDTCSYMGSIFKPLAYINHYVHGDFAASAAANFAVLSSDENRGSEIHASDPRKVMSANVMLQVKAFSSAAVRFFWPSTEKKLVEVPRERCSWCLHCKAPVTSKKACLLNQAALNATRAEMRFISGLRLVKNGEGGRYGIAAYMLFMEESLHGLILGPFQNASYRQQWRNNVEQVSTCSEMKSLLLELEENLCTIALSSEWTKLVDNWMDESSVPQSACPNASTQKRGTGRRKKHVATSEPTTDDSNDTSRDFDWSRRGKLAKLVFQRGTFPRSVIKKAARQGGSRRIPGVYYAETSDVPKRSRQFIWRAAVEMARSVSQLALQVRYLDHHIKWSDLLRPEQNLQDGKGPETEASAFRNARICDKRVVENKIMYGIAFGRQKHLPSRLMKSIIEKEESQDGNDKYWFLETRIPLYLIKEYEENAEKAQLPPPKKADPLSKLQRRQLKASRKNIFCYLARKRENIYMCFCASCHQEVSLGVAVKCSACEGYCHSGCTSSSTAMTNSDFEFITICKQCSHGKAFGRNNSSVESPTSPLAIQGQEYQNSATIGKSTKTTRSTSQPHQNSSTVVAKSVRPNNTSHLSPLVATSESHADKRQPSSDPNLTKNRKRLCHWGLIWKKKPTDDGSDFQLKHILFRGNSHGVNSLKPKCHLCQQHYNPHLMYIRCDTCQNWYHADALELDESKLPNLLGFKCCRCRRIKSPVCPYTVFTDKKTDVKKIRIKGPKEETFADKSVSEAISEQPESFPSTPMSPMEEDIFIQVDDPLLLSVSKVEQIPEPKAEVDYEWNTPCGPGPQKLPVRRHIKNEKEDDGCSWSNPSMVELPTSFDTHNISNPPQAEWNVSNGGLEDGLTFGAGDENFNYESVDYEPQTYFSFTELLEAEDGIQLEGVDLGSSNEIMATTSMEPVINGNCEICSQITPIPDLSCHNCGLQFHSYCSPWEDLELSQGESWSCGNCRAWR